MITRRRFLALAALAVPAAVAAEAYCLEPTMLRVRRLRTGDNLGCRLVHFTDFHYKGDAGYAASVIDAINALQADFACFTGDLVEDKAFAPEALDFIRQIKVPVYGNPGNHDYWSGADFREYEKAFAATGGAWLADRALYLPRHDLALIGGGRGMHMLPSSDASRQVLLMHYPMMVEGLKQRRFDLILAGHSHGGQIRLPGWGALVVPYGVGRYDLGLYRTPNGPMHVSSGIGTVYVPLRFNCPPAIALIEA